MNTPEMVIHNFIDWYTSNDERRIELKSTLPDPALYLHHDEKADDIERISNNIMNVMAWVNRNWSRQDETYLNLLRSVADYFEQDHIDGWESFEGEIDPTPDRDLTLWLARFGNKREEAQYGGVFLDQLMDKYNIAPMNDNWLNEAIDALEEIRKKKLPVCFKLNGKLFLMGGICKFTNEEGDDYMMIELFDMNTEMKEGISYSSYHQTVEDFPLASNKECQRVKVFLESLK